MKMTMQRQLFTIAAVFECLAGLAFILAPSTTATALLGAVPDSAGLMIARLAGVALFSLGIACWSARTDAGGNALVGIFIAIMLYNTGAGLLLVAFAVTGKAGGLVVWIAGILHLGLASAFAASLRRSGGNPAMKMN